MHSKQITIPLNVTIIAPDSWTAGFNGDTLVYTEHFDNPDPALIEKTTEVLHALFGEDLKVDPTDDGLTLTMTGVPQLFYGFIGELLAQMVVRDLLPESSMHQINALLRGPQLLPVPGVRPYPGLI